jgi:translocator protein
MHRRPSVLQYVLGVVFCQSAGIAGAFVTATEIPTWYMTLRMPTWQPPSWLFGPVWTVLYILMGIAGARIWAQTKRGDALRKLFGAQLLLNALWTPVFFGAHNLLGGLVIIFAMDMLVIALLFRLRATDRASVWLLLPYMTWILFATSLNAAILLLNP